MGVLEAWEAPLAYARLRERVVLHKELGAAASAEWVGLDSDLVASWLAEKDVIATEAVAEDRARSNPKG